MEIHKHHDWPATLEEAKTIQENLRYQVITTDQLNGGNQKTIKSCTTRYQIGSENLPIFEEKCG